MVVVGGAGSVHNGHTATGLADWQWQTKWLWVLFICAVTAVISASSPSTSMRSSRDGISIPVGTARAATEAYCPNSVSLLPSFPRRHWLSWRVDLAHLGFLELVLTKVKLPPCVSLEKVGSDVMSLFALLKLYACRYVPVDPGTRLIMCFESRQKTRDGGDAFTP